MKINWLEPLSRSLSARIEGRNTAIAALVIFGGFVFWVLVSSYEKHPLLSWIFCGLIFALIVLVAIASLLMKPQPSEVSEKWLVQMAGHQLFSAGGIQSFDELRELLRHAHNVHELPPPSGIVKGSALNASDYQDISAAEAGKITERDRAGVTGQLAEEAVNIAKSLLSGKITSSISGAIDAARQADQPISNNKLEATTGS